MNVLFVGAHPDDIETFCGGTAALLAEQGDKVFFCVATNGNVGLLHPAQRGDCRHPPPGGARGRPSWSGPS